MELSQFKLAYKIESNFINSYRNMHNLDNSVYWEDETTAGFVSGYPVPYLNCIFKFNSASSTPANEIQIALAPFKQRQCPMSWFVGVHTKEPEFVKTTLQAQGLKPSGALGNYMGMALDTNKFSYSQPAEELEITAVDGISKIEDFLKPFKIGFHASDRVAKYYELYMGSTLKRPSKEGSFVGYVNGSPVSTAAYYIDSGVALIHSVTTLPNFRKKGYARLLNEACIASARKKEDVPIVIYGSNMSNNLYRSMGFSDVYVMDNYLFDPNTN